MSKFTKIIGWQKYEDYIEKQLSCPILQNILQNMFPSEEDLIEDTSDDEDDESYSDMDEDSSKKNPLSSFIQKMLPLTPQVIDDISMLSNFDCWIGHTNFNITPKIRDQLNKVEGVEILKIFSRYRFFVGIGQMFDFQDVRHYIESKVIKGEIDD
jgi:hypothetical protein